jgi:hypothetical protein
MREGHFWLPCASAEGLLARHAPRRAGGARPEMTPGGRPSGHRRAACEPYPWAGGRYASRYLIQGPTITRRYFQELG